MTFRIGGRVVCINDTQPKEPTIYCKRLGRTLLQLGDMNGLKRGTIYTVRGVDLDWADESPVLFLEEIIRPRVANELHETGFLQSRFRPVIERKSETDISVFKKLLNPQKVLVTTDTCVNRAFHQYSCIEQGAR